MEGKVLKNFIISTSIWTVAIMLLINYTSDVANNIWSFLLIMIVILVIWLLVSTFLIVYFFKKSDR